MLRTHTKSVLKFLSKSILLISVLIISGVGKSVGPTAPFDIGTSNTHTVVAGMGEAQSIFADEPVLILVDDFEPQPLQGDTVHYYNRIGGDRGAFGDVNVVWGAGQVTTTISVDNSYGGVWMSFNHPIRERDSINFSAILPGQILSPYQSKITSLTVQIASGTSGSTFKLELKDPTGTKQWERSSILAGGQQILTFDLSLEGLEEITELVWLLDQSDVGDTVVIDAISLTATNPFTDAASAAFVWSYGMLLNNWNPATGLVRDRSQCASGEFEAIQSTGSLAAATVMAAQLGFISDESAVEIVTAIGNTLLNDVPRYHGLWPHFVEIPLSGEIAIVEGTEWSSVDTTIAALSLLIAQNALGLDTAGTEQMLQAIDWDGLETVNGISQGYSYAGELLTSSWDTFGGESWLVALAYAASVHQVPPIAYPEPPTANGSGFIDELAWLLVSPPLKEDYWGTNWTTYRVTAANVQTNYYCNDYPTSCFCQLGLFGLSAGEVPMPSAVEKEDIYQAFGVGGRFTSALDGSALLDGPVVVPHYAAMIASLHPAEAINLWAWLTDQGSFSPLNNAESMLFASGASCTADNLDWNELKGSWNLALQTLGWGRYLAEQRGQKPVLWQAAASNAFLHDGYDLLTPNELPYVYLPIAINAAP